MPSLINALLLLCLFLPSAICHTEKGWDYYRTILSTGMFPQAPDIIHPIVVDRTPVGPPPIRWELDYRVHMIYRHIKSGDTIVGVQNIKGSAPSFNLRVGERHEAEGIRVREVDWDDEQAVVTLEKDGKAVEFEIRDKVKRN